MKAVNANSGRDLAANLTVAHSFLSRSKGLLGRREFPRGEGLLIAPCKGVHTFFMKFPIDVVFLDKDKRVVLVVSNLRPYRITKVLASCAGVIELPAGAVSSSGTCVGNKILID